MRDPDRIELILSELKKYWESHPDLRLGQIISNVSLANSLEDAFWLEDSELLKELENLNFLS